MVESQQVTTVPNNQAVMPIPEVREMVPAYIWKTGVTFYLSKKEKVVADTFIATRSYAECSRALLKEGWKKNWLTCKRWLEKTHIADYLKEQFEEKGLAAGWTKQRWLLKMHEHLEAGKGLAKLEFELKEIEGRINSKTYPMEEIEIFSQARNKIRNEIKVLHGKRLANGDLYGMSLIAKMMGWEAPVVNRIGSINILQANGRD